MFGFEDETLLRRGGCRVRGFGLAPGPLWIALWVDCQFYRFIFTVTESFGWIRIDADAFGGKVCLLVVSESCGFNIDSVDVHNEGTQFWTCVSRGYRGVRMVSE